MPQLISGDCHVIEPPSSIDPGMALDPPQTGAKMPIVHPPGAPAHGLVAADRVSPPRSMKDHRSSLTCRKARPSSCWSTDTGNRWAEAAATGIPDNLAYRL